MGAQHKVCLSEVVALCFTLPGGECVGHIMVCGKCLRHLEEGEVEGEPREVRVQVHF